MITSRILRPLLLGLGATLLLHADNRLRAQDQSTVPPPRPVAGPRLAPTDHPPLPSHPSLYWLLPDVRASRTNAGTGEALARFTRGVGYIADSQFTLALP